MSCEDSEIKRRVAELERFQHSIPDAPKIRDIEHVIDELPKTDDIKETVRAHIDRATLTHRVFIGILIAVGGTVALSIAAALWAGVQVLAAKGVGS